MLFCGFDETRCGSIGLPATVSAASAGTTVNNDDGVAELAAGKVAAGVDLAVDDNAAADACAKCDSQCIVCACKCACLIFAVSCCVSVILQNDELAVCALCHHVAELEVLEIEVVSKFNDAGSTVNGARAADADPRYIVEGQAGLCQCIVAYSENRIAECVFRARNGRRMGSLCDDRVVFVYDTDGNVCAAYVNTKIVHNTNSL